MVMMLRFHASPPYPFTVGNQYQKPHKSLKHNECLETVALFESLYLISRFFFTTAQTREFPMILAIAKMDVTVVMATLADSNMTEEGQCHSRDLSTNIRQYTILSVRKKMDIIAEPAGKARQRSSFAKQIW